MPRRVLRILERGLAERPDDDRYATLDALLADLETCRRSVLLRLVG